MRERMQIITEKTGIPIGAVFGLMAFVVSATVGATMWVTTVNYRLASIENDLKAIKRSLIVEPDATTVLKAAPTEDNS